MSPTDDQKVYFGQAVALHRAGDLAAAEMAYRALIANAPDWAAPHSNLGALLRATGRLDDAEVELGVARRLAPGEINPSLNLGNLYSQQKRWASAAEAYRDVLAIVPNHYDALVSMGEACAALDQFAEAQDSFAAATDANPGHPDAWRALALLHGNLGRWQESEHASAQALAIAPDDNRSRANLGRFKLAQGDFGAGWPLYEGRVAQAGAGLAGAPARWRGEDLTGKSILLLGEQGFGDQIQFARFAPILRNMGADVTVLCAFPLLRLFEQLGIRVGLLAPGLPMPDADFWSPLMSVPLHLGVEERSIPAAPYLRAPDEARARWAGLVPSDGVGVVWHGSRTNQYDRHRSLSSLDVLAPLQAAGATFFDLQEPDGDFADAAARIELLRLVVTVDTALAHLAGALGKPVWVMLPRHFVDFRWLEGRADSPWYPSMRLFRQRELGDWGPVVEEMAAAMAADDT